MKPSRLLRLVGVLGAVAVPLSAQSLVANLKTSTGGQPSSGTDPFFVFAGGSLAVFDGSGTFGSEPYVTDGTPAGTSILVDLVPDGPSQPRDFLPFGNVVLFSANVPGLGRELWITDGTTAGTQLLKDIRPGSGSSTPEQFVELGGLVYFVATDGSNGAELWRTDGTAAGTVLAVDVRPGFTGSNPGSLTRVGAELYFSANDGSVGTELYKSDGTPAGTVLVADLTPGTAGTTMSDFFAFGGLLLFAADVSDGREPYVSDGTAAGTLQLMDIAPGPDASSPRDWSVVGGLCVFSADDPATGREPYATDGTVAGTQLLADLDPGAGDGNPTEFAAVNGVLVFGARGANGRELFRTDGTPAGTFELVDLNAGAGSADPDDFAVVGAEVWFSAFVGGVGNELWRTDGTAAGTSLLADLVGGNAGVGAVGTTPFGGGVLFRGAFGGAGSFEPCFTDGTSAGTVLLDDLSVPVSDSSPELFLDADVGTVAFVANGDGVGSEPFVSDGTPSGTQLLVDVEPGSGGSNIDYLTRRGVDLFFDGSVGGQRQLYVFDGAGGVLTQLTSASPPVAPRGITTNGNLVLFSGASSATGREPWVSDGTPAGTFELLDLRPGAADSIAFLGEDFTTAGLRTFFSANDGSNGIELWVTDGTSAGTSLVADIRAGSGSSNPDHLTAVGGLLYFSATDGASGTELWVSDGTAAGTSLVVDLRPGLIGSGPGELVASGNLLYFAANPGGGDELFVHDANTGSVVALTALGAGATNPIRDVTATQNGVFFLHDDLSGFGEELWFSDGTPAGAQRVRDVAPGPASGPLRDTVVAALGGTQVLFAANDLQNGLQLWRSDGTAANTVQVTSFGGPGYGAVRLREFYSTGARTFFACDDGINGLEPWVYDAATGAVAFVLPYGSPCGGGVGGGPVIGANGLPTLGNAGFAITLGNAPPLTLAVPAGSEGSSSISLGAGCRLWLDAPIVLLGTELADAGGVASTALPIPNQANLTGYGLFFQWAVYEPGGPFLGDFTLTGGLQVQLGN